MVSDALVQAGLSGAVGVGGGFLAGYAFRKIIKIFAIILGAFFIALMYMQFQGFLSIRWDRIDHSVQSVVQSTNITQSIGTEGINHILGNLGIPLTSGLAIGFTAGFLRG